MDDPAFAQLIGQLTEALGQQMGSSRQVPEGLLLQTTDGFLYAFVADPKLLSLSTVQKLISESPGGARHLVVFCREHLPLAFSAELLRASATLVEGGRFGELARSLGLETLLGEEPRPGRVPAGRLLPSAQHLDALMNRARTWLEWGVPALGLRFYRQASELKPEFLPARNGIATSLLALGLVPEARQGYNDVLAAEPGNLEARIGLAAVLGAEGHVDEELAAYRTLLAEHPEQLSIRAHLVAALVDHRRWGEARGEIASMLEKVPEDARLRYLHSVALEKSGETREAVEERARARKVGLTEEQERQLALQLGLPPPKIPPTAVPVPPALASPAPAPAVSPPAPPPAPPPAARRSRPAPRRTARKVRPSGRKRRPRSPRRIPRPARKRR